MYPILLASSSPRRQEILKFLNIPFVVHPADIPEDAPLDMEPEKVPEFLANKKVEAVAKTLPADLENQWILGADTLVLCKGKLFGKPQNQDEAADFLKALQGKSHKVITGISLYNGALHEIESRASCNSVTFAPMTDEEIEWYIGTGEWHGAAGGYRIQGLASCFIKKIEGSESSIMGLPIFELYDMLKAQGYSLLT